MPFLERAASSSRVGPWSVLGLILVPLLIASGFLWATWDSTDRLDRVQAAVVNLDEPVELDGQTVPLGRQLAGGLVSGPAEADKSDEAEEADADEDAVTNFDWVLTDATDADAGLKSGRYAAVVTIPKTFSARATSFSGTDPDKIRAATIDVQTSQTSGITDPLVGQAITAAATEAVNTSLTENYLQNIYVGFNDLGKQFRTVADASGELADGTDQLSDGLDGASGGTTKLADGLGQLDDGAQQLATGATGLSTGTTALADGLGELADGTKALPGSTRKLADGAQKSADGAGSLADGAGSLATGASSLSGGAGTLAGGAQQLAGGVDALRNGTKAQPGGTKAFAAGVQQYAAGVEEYRDTFAQLAAAPDDVVLAQVPTLCPEGIPAEACSGIVDAFQGGVTATLAGFEDTEDPRTGASVPGLIPSAQQLATGATGIDGGVAQLSTGASGLAGGATKLSTGAKQLSGGAAELSGGAEQLAGGLDQLADGTDKLADGLKPLAKGIASSATGAEKLADGAEQLSTGVSGLATGTAASSTGAAELATGTEKLAAAGDQLADGSRELADGLAEGADAVPTYDKPTREKLSTVVTTPVDTPAPTSAFSDVSTTTFLAVLALWVGGLATYLVLRAVSARVLSSMRSSWRLALDGLLPGLAIGAVQALALTVVLQQLLDLSIGRALPLAGFAVLTAAAFVAINHALVAWFGGVGHFVSVLLVVAGAAGAVTDAVPASFDALRPFLPLTPALDGFRALAGDGTGAGAAAGVLLAWLLLGVVAGVLAVARRRVVAPLVATEPLTSRPVPA